MNDQQITANMLKLASTLVGEKKTASRELTAAEVTVELTNTIKAAETLAEQFKDTHAGLIASINEAEKQLKEQKNMLKAYVRDWSKQSGYGATKKALLQQAQQCLETGEMLEGLSDTLEIGKRESSQESYKEKYNVLVSMLNEAELKKYSRLLNSYYRKQTTELKTGVKELDGAIKEWHETAQDIAKERGIKLPRASKMASAIEDAKARNAGILDALMDAIKGIIPNLVRKMRDWGKRFFKSVVRNGQELDDITSDIQKLTSQALRVLK